MSTHEDGLAALVRALQFKKGQSSGIRFQIHPDTPPNSRHMRIAVSIASQINVANKSCTYSIKIESSRESEVQVFLHYSETFESKRKLNPSRSGLCEFGNLIAAPRIRHHFVSLLTTVLADSPIDPDTAIPPLEILQCFDRTSKQVP